MCVWFPNNAARPALWVANVCMNYKVSQIWPFSEMFDWCFRGAYSLHHQGDECVNVTFTAMCLKMAVFLDAVPCSRWLFTVFTLMAEVVSSSSQKTAVFLFIAVTTRKLTKLIIVFHPLSKHCSLVITFKIWNLFLPQKMIPYFAPVQNSWLKFL